MADLLAAAAASLAATPSVTESFRALAFLPLWVLLSKLLGLYDRDHRAIRHLTVDEIPALSGWAIVGAAMLVPLLELTSAGPVAENRTLRVFAVALGTAFILRATVRWIWRQVTPPERTLVLGEGEFRNAILRKAMLFRDMHLALVDSPSAEDAWLGMAESAGAGQNGHGPHENGNGNGNGRAPVAGRLDRAILDAALRDVDRLIVASPRVTPDMIGELSAACRTNQVKLSVVSPLRGRACPALRISQVADLPLFEYNTWDVSRSTMLLKRVFDVVIGGLVLLLALPFVPLIALAIKLDSPGPVFFSQVRAGLNGRPFRMLKFRTMRRGAPKELGELVAFDELEEPVFKLRGDPRITRVGRVLRRFSLDEIPQLVNVLRGEMSIVGPRPEQVELVERYLPDHHFRLTVKPGITGPMQVFGRGELTFAERLAVELDYVENMSLVRDARILFHTLPALVRGTGAF